LTTAADVDTLHRSDCTLCHSYTGTNVSPAIVRQAIKDGMSGILISCGDCHIDNLTGHGVPVTGKHQEHFALMGESCDLCHGTNTPPLFADGQDLTGTSVCDSCHQDADGIPTTGFKDGWANDSYNLSCDGCHKGRPNLDEDVISSHGHDRLVGETWIRQYPCSHCHYDTVNADWVLKASHASGDINVTLDPQWKIVGENLPSYDEQTKVCTNLYCHTDGTTVAPEKREYPWTDGHKNCNACHGHAPSQTCSTASCHQNEPDKAWSDEERWLSAMPMYENSGPGTPNANSHFRHLFSGFSCDDCHFKTVTGGECTQCHNGVDASSSTSGNMVEDAHIDEDYHVNLIKDVDFKDGGMYNRMNKSCSSTACHTGGTDPVWGDSVNDGVVCINCHGTTGGDVDDFGAFNGVRGKISKSQWDTKGHGKPEGSGNYSQSGNPPANFTNNGCWYCHDNKVLHQDDSNPFRLRQHQQFADRFEKECVYCHMSGLDVECMGCHNDADGESLAPQLATIGELTDDEPRPDHSSWADGQTSCVSECHADDASIHKTDAGLWSQSQKDDVKNSYVMMGVCLKCHDDDSNGGCTGCHTAPEDDPETPDIDESKKYELGFDPGLPGLGFIKPQQARATSFHFGYKHYQDYEDSLDDPPLDSGSVDVVSTSTGQIIDSTKVGVWDDNQYVGRRVTVTSGVNAGLTRPIVRNTVKQIDVDGDGVFVDVEVITVFPPFPDDQPLALGDTYEIMDHVWKGGKFCWDCHDPHGDGNIFMIQDMVATRTDGEFGKPISRASVEFTKKQIGTDYARTVAPYNGICNVCHSEDSKHYTKIAGDGHQTGRVCTTCHEHRFTDSHASGRPCNDCHQNKPVPRHTGFSQPRDCTKCHQGAILNRMDIMGQFAANSHHIQDVEVKSTHCYACHWEATEDGLINVEHHEGYNYKTHESTPNAKVDLIIWGPGDPDEDGIPTASDDNKTLGSRPIVYDPFGTDPDGPGVQTVTQFLASNISGTLAEQRHEVENITPHCLGCHSDQNNDTEPFNDCKTPRQYAWDFSSVDSRYSNMTEAPWGKYTAKITKAFSAHGNAKKNGGGFDPSTGVDGDVTNTRAGDYNVQCFDCHSSHGSYVNGTTSNYTTFNGTKNGGNLKETQAGKGGYLTTYKASSNVGSPDPNQYAAGAGQCFDCHETETAGATPWGYSSTFGATEPILGYYDTPRFGNGKNGSETRFPYKDRAVDEQAGIVNHMGHYGVSEELLNPAEGQINGLCTPCHDPHGVSRAFGDDMEYALPLLTGTWLTTPYKEDAAAKAKPQTPWQGNYRGKVPAFDVPSAGVYLNETVQQFAGLCLKCHPQSTLSPDTNTTWASSDRIHDTVQGWGSSRHSYSCSKCHTPHANRLPRLLVTNCLDGNHSGQVVSGGATSGSDWGEAAPSDDCYEYDECGGSGSGNWNQGGFGDGDGWDEPYHSYTNTSPVAGCHENPDTPRLDDKRSWNNVSPW
jgi:predicted CxxxxCH...CXXCH cytochrome family protein